MKNKLLICFAISLLSFSIAQAQYQVLDSRNNKGVSGVFIYSTGGAFSTESDKNGSFSISDKLKGGDTLYFQHPSYQDKFAIVSDLKTNNKVLLTEFVFMLPEVILSASKREEDISQVPNQILSVPLQEIQFENPQTAADIIDQSGQVHVQKSQQGGGSPMIRGFTANSILLVTDGVRMNNAIYREGNLQNIITVDANALRSTEVFFGPGSVVYGSDALGGVVSLNSLQAERPSDTVSSKSSVLMRTQSANQEGTFHAHSQYGTRKLGGMTSMTFSSFRDLRAGKKYPSEDPDFGKRGDYVLVTDSGDFVLQNKNPEIQIGSGYKQLNITQKINWRIHENSNLEYGIYVSSSSDIPRYDRLIQRNSDSTLRFADWHYGPQNWLMNRLAYQVKAQKPLFTELNIIAAHQKIDEDRIDRRLNSPTERHREEDVQVMSLNIDLDKRMGEKHLIQYGLEGVYNKVTSSAYTIDLNNGNRGPESTRYPDGGSTYSTYAAYGMYHFKPSNVFNYSAGLRYSQIHSVSKFDDTTFFKFPYDEIVVNTGALNGSLGLVINPSSSWRIASVLSTGFRAPNIDDIGKVFDSQPGAVMVPNPDLKPETAYNAEISIGYFPNSRLKMSVTTYYTYLVDAIVRGDFTFNGQDSIMYDGTKSKVLALTNTGEAYVAGISGSVEWSLNREWKVFSSYTITEGMDIVDDVPLRSVPPSFGKSGLVYKPKNLKAEFYARYSGAIAFEDLSPTEQDKPYLYSSEGALAWYTLNLKASYQLSETFTVDAGVENILDVHYRTYSSGISAPGRNIIVAARLQF